MWLFVFSPIARVNVGNVCSCKPQIFWNFLHLIFKKCKILSVGTLVLPTLSLCTTLQNCWLIWTLIIVLVLSTNIEEAWPPILTESPISSCRVSDSSPESYLFQFHEWDCLECWAKVNKQWFHTGNCLKQCLAAQLTWPPASLKNLNGCACYVIVMWQV